MDRLMEFHSDRSTEFRLGCSRIARLNSLGSLDGVSVGLLNGLLDGVSLGRSKEFCLGCLMNCSTEFHLDRSTEFCLGCSMDLSTEFHLDGSTEFCLGRGKLLDDDWHLGFYGGRTRFPLSLKVNINSHSTCYSLHSFYILLSHLPLISYSLKRVGKMLPCT